AGGADYVLALKGNHETLHQAVIAYIDEQLEGDLADAQEHVTTEKAHGREETRTYLPLPAPEQLPGFLQWKGLKSIGLATSHCFREGKETVEVRYYLSSLEVDAQQFARAIRGHWRIEIPQPDCPRSDNLCVAGQAGYHHRGGLARAGLVA
ncbi:MAG: ISAs1 family transposase, partial [Solirubrobacterales bacterium]|nr:ISAs1 family transposase [Solirubrobacterales bacterium]